MESAYHLYKCEVELGGDNSTPPLFCNPASDSKATLYANDDDSEDLFYPIKPPLSSSSSSSSSKPSIDKPKSVHDFMKHSHKHLNYSTEISELLTIADCPQRRAKLIEVLDHFSKAATSGARDIIDKNLSSVQLGGQAGGEKYLQNGLLFKLAKDTELTGGSWLYGGAEPSHYFAGKAASNELKASNTLFRVLYENGIPVVVPLQVLIDYRGQRVVAMSILNLVGDSLIYGSRDGGQTVRNSDSVFSALMRRVAGLLHLAEHDVRSLSGASQRMHLAGDVEGHKDAQGNYYLLDLARMWPPEWPSHRPSSSIFFRLLRPEFLAWSRAQGHPALSADGYSSWAGNDKFLHNSNLHSAFRILIDNRIRELATFLSSSLSQDSLTVETLVSDAGTRWEWPAELSQQVVKWLKPFRRDVQCPTQLVPALHVLVLQWCRERGVVPPSHGPWNDEASSLPEAWVRRYHTLEKEMSISSELHRFGVPVRHLKTLLPLAERHSPQLTSLLKVEAIQRSVKFMVRAILRSPDPTRMVPGRKGKTTNTTSTVRSATEIETEVKTAFQSRMKEVIALLGQVAHGALTGTTARTLEDVVVEKFGLINCLQTVLTSVQNRWKIMCYVAYTCGLKSVSNPHWLGSSAISDHSQQLKVPSDLCAMEARAKYNSFISAVRSATHYDRALALALQFPNKPQYTQQQQQGGEVREGEAREERRVEQLSRAVQSELNRALTVAEEVLSSDPNESTAALTRARCLPLLALQPLSRLQWKALDHSARVHHHELRTWLWSSSHTITINPQQKMEDNDDSCKSMTTAIGRAIIGDDMKCLALAFSALDSMVDTSDEKKIDSGSSSRSGSAPGSPKRNGHKGEAEKVEKMKQEAVRAFKYWPSTQVEDAEVVRAVQLQSVSLLKALLYAKGNVNARATGSYQYSALHFAARDGNLPALQTLIEGGVDINGKDSKHGMTALHIACDQGHTNIIKALLAAGADPTILDFDHRVAVIPEGLNSECAATDEVEIRRAQVKEAELAEVQALCKAWRLLAQPHANGDDGDGDGGGEDDDNHPVDLALRLLLAHSTHWKSDAAGSVNCKTSNTHTNNINISINSNDGQTTSSSSEQTQEKVKEDAKHKTTSSSSSSKPPSSSPPSSPATKVKEDNNSPSKNSAVKASPSPSPSSTCTVAPEAVARARSLSIAIAIAEAGVHPLLIACREGSSSAVKALLLGKADVHITNQMGDGVVHQCVLGTHAHIIKMVVGSGANINARRHDGRTPLMLAACEGNDNIAMALLSQNADLYAENGKGERAFDVNPGLVKDVLQRLYSTKNSYWEALRTVREEGKRGEGKEAGEGGGERGGDEEERGEEEEEGGDGGSKADPGLALFSFTPDPEEQGEDGLPLRAGDVVWVLDKENEEWWFGSLAADPTKQGFFPAAHVHIFASM